MEKNRKIVFIFVFIAFAIFYIYTRHLSYQAEIKYVNRMYIGVITEIRIIEGSHDIPDIKINNQWISFDLQDSKVKHYIQIGDSIVKESGTEIIKVYRKNLKEEWSV
jgi:hypothetical protein